MVKKLCPHTAHSIGHTCILLLFLVLLLSILSIPSSAHPGRTDMQGGHVDASTGEYHFHHGYSAHKHADFDGDGVIDCPYDFDQGPSSSGSSSGSSSSSDSSIGWRAPTNPDGSVSYPTRPPSSNHATSTKPPAAPASDASGNSFSFLRFMPPIVSFFGWSALLFVACALFGALGRKLSDHPDQGFIAFCGDQFQLLSFFLAILSFAISLPAYLFSRPIAKRDASRARAAAVSESRVALDDAKLSIENLQRQRDSLISTLPAPEVLEPNSPCISEYLANIEMLILGFMAGQRMPSSSDLTSGLFAAILYSDPLIRSSSFLVLQLKSTPRYPFTRYVWSFLTQTDVDYNDLPAILDLITSKLHPPVSPTDSMYVSFENLLARAHAFSEQFFSGKATPLIGDNSDFKQ